MAMNAEQLRAAILAVNDVEPVPIDVPEWKLGEPVFLRPMTAGGRDRWEGELLERTDKRKQSIQEAVEDLRAVFLTVLRTVFRGFFVALRLLRAFVFRLAFAISTPYPNWAMTASVV